MNIRTLNDVFFTVVSRNHDRVMLQRENGAWKPITAAQLHRSHKFGSQDIQCLGNTRFSRGAQTIQVGSPDRACFRSVRQRLYDVHAAADAAKALARVPAAGVPQARKPERTRAWRLVTPPSGR